MYARPFTLSIRDIIEYYGSFFRTCRILSPQSRLRASTWRAMIRSRRSGSSWRRTYGCAPSLFSQACPRSRLLSALSLCGGSGTYCSRQGRFRFLPMMFSSKSLFFDVLPIGPHASVFMQQGDPKDIGERLNPSARAKKILEMLGEVAWDLGRT